MKWNIHIYDPKSGTTTTHVKDYPGTSASMADAPAVVARASRDFHKRMEYILAVPHRKMSRGHATRKTSDPDAPWHGRDIARAGSVASYGIQIGGLRYHVDVARDLQRGGFSAKLRSEGIGTLMEPNGRTPSEALTQLTRELAQGDTTDRKLAREITRRAWFKIEL